MEPTNEQIFASHYVLSLQERVAMLEVQMKELSEIREKLDQLLELKAKGMGAMGLVGLVIGSGFIGIVAAIVAFLKKGHM